MLKSFTIQVSRCSIIFSPRIYTAFKFSACSLLPASESSPTAPRPQLSFSFFIWISVLTKLPELASNPLCSLYWLPAVLLLPFTLSSLCPWAQLKELILKKSRLRTVGP